MPASVLGDWFDSLPDADNPAVDNAFQLSGLDALDSIFGGRLSQQTRANMADPTYVDREAEAERQAAADEEANYRKALREQRREELLNTTQFEDVPTSARLPIGIAQGLYGIGRQAGGLLDALRIPGGRDIANWAQDQSNQLGELTDVPDSAASPVGEFTQWLSNNATSVIPSLASGALGGGITAAALAGAAQTFGSVFEDAQDKYQEAGVDPASARNRSYLPALISGLSTAVLTKYFGPHGIEALIMDPNRELIKEALREPLMTVLKGVGGEFAEEGLDQLVQGIVAMKSYDPKKSLASVVSDAVQAGAAGGILGGLGESVPVAKANLTAPADIRAEVDAERPASLRRGVRSPIPDTTPLTNEALPPSSDATAAQPRGRSPLGDWFDQLSDVVDISPVGPGIEQPGTAVNVNEEYPIFSPQEQPNPTAPAVQAARAAQAAMESQANLRPGRIPNIQIDEFNMPAGIEQPLPPIVQLGLLRRGRRIQPGGQNATITREEILQQQREGVDGQVQGNGQDRNVPPEVQTQSPQAVVGNSLPASPVIGGVQNGEEIQAQEGQQEGVLNPAKVAGRSKTPAAPRDVRPDDIIDFIRDQIGKIRGKKSARPGTEGYYSEAYNGLLNRSAVRGLFTNDGSGQSPDTVVDDLRRAGYLKEDATVDDLWDLLDGAAAKRQTFVEDQRKFEKEIKEKESQRIDFEQSAMGEQSRWAQKDTISTADLLVGDKFKIGGEEFTVKDLHWDPETDTIAYVEVEDGKRYGTQTVSGNQVLHVSKGSYRPNESATEFVPKTERELSAEEIANIDRQINALKEKATLTPDEHRQLQLLEQERGQKFMEFNDPVRIAADLQAQQNRADVAGRVPARPQGVQQDMFGKPEPGQEEMFSLGRAAQAALNPRAKSVLAAFLRMPVMRDLDWSGLQVELADLEKGVVGRRVGRLIQLSKDAPASTFPHEIAHILFDVLPAEHRQAIESERQAELAKRYPRGIPADMAQGMTSREFVDAGHPAEDYALANTGEYLAHLFADKVSQKAFEERHGVGAWQRLRNWFIAMMDAVKRAFGRRPDLERVIREMIAGTWQPNLNEDAKVEDQLSYRKTAESAQNAARLAKSAEEKEVEGHNQLAQSTDLLSFLVKHGANLASAATKKALNFVNLSGINAAGESLIGAPLDYNAVQAATASSPVRSKLAALAASTQVRAFDETLEEAIRKSDEAQSTIAKPGFIRKLAKDAALQSEADTAAMINRVITPMFDSAYKMAKKALDEESRNDVRIAQLEAQLKEVDNGRRSSSAMSILVKDMVDVLSSSPEGIALLSNPDTKRGDLVALYKDIKRSVDQPTYNDSLLNWGGFILERNSELKDTLWASQLSRNSGIRAGMGAYETKLIADLEKDEKGTILREMRAVSRRQKKEDLARFAYQTLHKEVMDEMGKAATAIEAGDIATQIKNDPDYKAFRKKVYDDAGVEGTFESFIPGKDETFPLPSGELVDISVNGMRGTKVPTERWAQWDKARAELYDWLTNNPDHPDYGVHEKNLQNLEEFYYNESVLNPHDREQAFEGMLNTVLDAVRNVGGRGAAMVSKLVPRWSFLKEQAGHWSPHWSKLLIEQRVKTLKSHGIKWKQNGGKESIEPVNKRFYDQHLNQVLYSLNREAGALKVGDVTQSGMKVTQEDLNDAKLQHEATKAGFQIIEKNFGRDNFVIDKRSGYTLQRKPGKTAEDMVPRVLSDTGQSFLNDFKAARDEYRAAKTPAQQQAATNKQIQLINENWDLVVYPYLWDRNANFAKETPFDGMGGAYEQIAQKMEQYPGMVSSFDDLINEVMSLASVTKDEAQAIILTDMGQMFENGLKEETDSGLINTPITGEKKNTFTRARGAEVLPYSFYKYGFADSPAVHRFAGMIHSRAFEKVLNGLNQLKGELEQRRKDLEKKASKVGLTKAINDRAIERANGKNFDSFDHLDTKLANVKKVLAYMTEDQPESEADVALARIVSGVQGSIIGNVMTTARNLLAGPKYLATLNMRLNGRGVFESLPSAYQLWVLQGLLKAMPHLAKSLAIGTAKSIPGMARAVKAFATNKDSRLRSFFGEAAHEWLKETGTEIYNRQKDIIEAQARGLDTVPDLSLEFRNKLAAGFLAGGELLSQEIHGTGKKLGLGIATALDVLNTPLKGLFSALGEHSLNAGIMKSMAGKFGHKEVMRRALDKVYDQIKSGARKYNFNNAADPVNQLVHQEVMPSKSEGRLFSNEADLKEMESLYQDAGLSAQSEFWKYLKQRNDGVAKPEYLKGEAENLLATYMQGVLNKATPAQQPLILQGKSATTKILRPLLGWSTRTLNGLHRILAVPATTGDPVVDAKNLQKARVKQFLTLATLTLLPALMAFSAAGLGEEKGARLISKYLWGQERSSRYPWEREGTQSQAIGWLLNATYGIPFVDMVINTMLNDLPARASLDPNFVMVNKFKDLANYIGGVVQTGDPGFGLPRLIEGFYPDSRAILNRIESEQGKRAGADVVAMLRRLGPQDLMKPMGGPSAGPNYTPLSPYGQRMENAALRQDWAELQSIYDEAVQKATDLGKDNPEKLVRQMFEARNPFTRALKTKMSEEQYQTFLSKLEPDERAIVENVVSAFDQGGNLIGTNPSVTKEERQADRGGSGGGSILSAMARGRRPGQMAPMGSASLLSSLKAGRQQRSLARLSRSGRGNGLRRGRI